MKNKPKLGRPAVMVECPWCHKKFSKTDMRLHITACMKRNQLRQAQAIRNVIRAWRRTWAGSLQIADAAKPPAKRSTMGLRNVET